MSTTATIAAAPTLFETPTSKVANAVDTLSLDAKPLDLTQKLTEAPKPEELEVDASRNRFVGDVDLDEKDEPLLKESKRRFVLFPIQYNEVCVIQAFGVWLARVLNGWYRFGKCTRRRRHLSGLLRRWTSPRTSTTGRIDSTTTNVTLSLTFSLFSLPPTALLMRTSSSGFPVKFK